MRVKRTYLTQTTHGHVMLVIEDASFLKLLWLRLLLQFKYGFHRQGSRVLGVGEAIFPDFVKSNMRLFAGYTDMVGFTLHSETEEADTFLRKFGERYAHQGAPADVSVGAPRRQSRG